MAATVSGQLDDDFGEVVGAAATNVRGRVVVVGIDGRLLADSAGTDRLGSDYRGRPEIDSALRGDAVPGAPPQRDARRGAARDGGADRRGAASASAPCGSPRASTRSTARPAGRSSAWSRSACSCSRSGLAAGVVIARQIAGPLRRLDAAAAQVAEGDLSVRARVEGSAEQRNLARTFNDMTARLERIVAGQRDFVADASHQLRTPLSGLRLRLEEARAVSDDPEVHEEIDAGLAELDRLAAIISELLLLSQAGEVDAPARAGRPRRRRPARRRPLGRDRRRPRGRRRGRAGRTRLLPGRRPRPRARRADRERGPLRRRATSPSWRGRAGSRCSTAGPGLAGEELDAVFERFHRGRAGRGGPAGTGLGLAIARELARRWGGDVELANRPEGGAAARITVPAPPRERFPVS